MTERYLLPCIRCRNLSVETGPVLDDAVSCNRCGATQRAADYAAVHAMVLRFRDQGKAETNLLPCQDCGAFAVPWSQGADPMADTPCSSCGRPQFLDDYQAEIHALAAWHGHLQASRAQALADRFAQGVLCPSCKQRLHPSVDHAGAGVPCGHCGTFTPMDYWLHNEVLPDAPPPGEPEPEPTKSHKNKILIGCGCVLALSLGLGLVAAVLVLTLG